MAQLTEAQRSSFEYTMLLARALKAFPFVDPELRAVFCVVAHTTTSECNAHVLCSFLRRATGDPAYLNDAKAFFGAYQSSTEAVISENLIVDWNNNYWSTAVLLASLTDLDAYHYQAQTFLGNWICSTSNVVTYTKQGRAWNANKGALYNHVVYSFCVVVLRQRMFAVLTTVCPCRASAAAACCLVGTRCTDACCSSMRGARQTS